MASTLLLPPIRPAATFTFKMKQGSGKTGGDEGANSSGAMLDLPDRSFVTGSLNPLPSASRWWHSWTGITTSTATTASGSSRPTSATALLLLTSAAIAPRSIPQAQCRQSPTLERLNALLAAARDGCGSSPPPAVPQSPSFNKVARHGDKGQHLSWLPSASRQMSVAPSGEADPGAARTPWAYTKQQ